MPLTVSEHTITLADAIPATFSWTYRDPAMGFGKVAQRTKTVSLTPENFAIVKAENTNAFISYSLHSYEDAKDRDLRSRDQRIKQKRDYVEWQDGRLKDWKQTFKREAGEWVAL